MDVSELSFSKKIVLELAEELLNQGCHLYVDNFYGKCGLVGCLFITMMSTTNHIGLHDM